ncbi:MAG TPA: viroplasmin family protein [Candidatus Barnesiella excrementavium]|nr:viroplasmin family protein [Candidatus Barnesiella excrementavium]
MAKYKYYVVWEGRARGIFNSWEECKEQVENFKGAKYKSFDDLESATEAFRKAPDDYFGILRKIGEHSRERLTAPTLPSAVIADSLAVDAACSGNPGHMEYRGVDTKSGIELFHVGPMPQGTNNIGEFLALVHGLAYLQQRGSQIPIYSDSRNAIAWVRQKKCKTKLTPNAANAPIFDLIARAERWLQTHTYTNPIIKWETERWGEIPADFGRK